LGASDSSLGVKFLGVGDGVWELRPQQGPRVEPLVRGSGRQSPPEAETLA